MKKIICLVLLLASTLSLFACGENDGYKTYTEGHVTFRLPETLEKKNVSYADVYYSNKDMNFRIKSFSNSQLEEDGYYSKITITDYVSLFMLWNGYTADYVYDKERELVTFDEVTTFEGEYDDGTGNIIVHKSHDYDYFMFFRQEGGITVITINCKGDRKAEFEEIFKYIASTVVIK